MESIYKHIEYLKNKYYEYNLINGDFNKLVKQLKTNEEIYLGLAHKIKLKELRKIKKILKSNSTVVALRFMSNYTGFNGAKILSKLLMKNKTIQYLYITRNMIKDEGVRYLADALKINNTLKTLDLTDNSIDEKDIIKLSESLKEEYKQFDVVINHYSTNEGVLDPHVINYAKQLANDANLLKCYLPYGKKLNKSVSRGMQNLAEALKINNSLTSLTLSDNEINKGIVYIASALKINSTLIYLDLSKNKINNDYIFDLSDALKVNSSLQYLNLSGNKISDGVIYIADALKINSTLKHLDLSDNKINDKIIYPFIDVLRHNNNLEYLDFRGNNITQIEINHLVDILWFNTSLRKIYFYKKFSVINLPEITHQLDINNNPIKYQKEFDLKLKNRIIYCNIQWEPKREIHSQFPLYIRKQIRYLFVLLVSRNVENWEYFLPFEIWIDIIKYYARSFIDLEGTDKIKQY